MSIVYLAIAAIIVVGIVLYALRLIGKGVSKGDSVILLGLTNSGKTVLFLQLRDGKFSETHTSMKENSDTFPVKGSKPINVVDVAGHERVRLRWADYAPIARGIVFVVDAVDFQTQTRPVTEFLFDVLTNKNVHRKKIPIQIVCNKQDIVTAVGKESVKSGIEKEIDQLRRTRKAIPTQGTDESIDIGVEGQPFSFSQLSNEVTFAVASGKEGEIQNVSQFINKLFS